MHEPTLRGLEHRSLQTLYERCRSLPGERRDLCVIVKDEEPQGQPEPVLGALDQHRLALLRRRTAGLIKELATIAETELNRALGEFKWDQIDALELVPSKAHVVRTQLENDWRAFVAKSPDDTRDVAHSAMREAQATLATVFDLLKLCERRMATFVRLRRTQQDDRLMLDGRPFLDVARALFETAEAYS